MLNKESQEFKNLIAESAKLRDSGQFVEALGVVECRLEDMDPHCLIDARHHAIIIAKEGGLNEVAMRHATELAKIAPEHPVLIQLRHEGGLGEVAMRKAAH